MTEIARSGQQRRLAILVARITRDHLEGRQGLIDLLPVLVCEFQLQQAKIVFDVHVLTEPRTNDDSRDGSLIQDQA